MILRLLLSALALAPFTMPLEAGVFERLIIGVNAEPAPPIIPVLIAYDKSGALIEVKGQYKLYDPHTNEHVSTRFIGKRKYMQALSDGLQWGEEFPGLHQLMIVPDNQGVTTLVDGVEYRGTIVVYDVEGKVGVVNELDIEDYLHSLLPRDVHEQLPAEALAALAIAARTNAYYQANSPTSPYWAANGEKIGYQGFVAAQPESPIGTAIDATRYMILSKGENEQGEILAFPATWASGQGDAAQISLQQAVEMANKGANAGQILAKAFPGTTIKLTYIPKRKK